LSINTQGLKNSIAKARFFHWEKVPGIFLLGHVPKTLSIVVTTITVVSGMTRITAIIAHKLRSASIDARLESVWNHVPGSVLKLSDNSVGS
jgi:hypothetical protein